MPRLPDHTDRTMPRRRRDVRPTGLTWGHFVRTGNTVALVDRDGNVSTLPYVEIQHGGWGFDGEGFEKLPRPQVVDATTGEIVIEGDRVRIDYVYTRKTTPPRAIVSAGFRSVHADEWLARDHGTPGANPNRLRARVQPLDAAGKPTGRVDVKIADADKGTAYLGTTDGYSFACGADLDNPDVMLTVSPDRLLIDVKGLRLQVDKDKVRLGDEGATDAVTLAPLVLARLNALEASFNAHTHLYLAGPGPAAPSATPVPTASSSTLDDIAATKVNAT